MVLNKSESDYWIDKIRKLQRKSEDIEGVAIVTADGLTLASSLPTGTQDHDDLIAASLAAGASLALNLMNTATQSSLDQLYFRCQYGYIIVMLLSNETVMAVLTKPGARLGAIFLDNDGDILSPDPIFPPRPPKHLFGRAKPEYDDLL